MKKNMPKGVNEILEEQIETALNEYQRSNSRLFISAFAAGLEVGFSVFLIGILHTLFYGKVSDASLQVMLSFAYPIGFIFVVIGKSELFTEHTTLAVLPVLNRVSSLKSLFVLWGIILAGNLAVGMLFSVLLTSFAPAMGIIDQATFGKLAEKVVDFPPGIVLMSAIVAGWLMGLLSWLVASSQETISRIFVIILVTVTIGLGGLHHSIVGSIEVFSGWLTDSKIQFTDYLSFELIAIAGNAIGGVFFVSVVKYGQKRKR